MFNLLVTEVISVNFKSEVFLNVLILHLILDRLFYLIALSIIDSSEQSLLNLFFISIMQTSPLSYQYATMGRCYMDLILFTLFFMGMLSNLITGSSSASPSLS